MRNGPAGLSIGQPTGRGLQHVQVIQDIVKAAIVGESLKKIANRLLDLHGIPRVRNREGTQYTPR